MINIIVITKDELAAMYCSQDADAPRIRRAIDECRSGYFIGVVDPLDPEALEICVGHSDPSCLRSLDHCRWPQIPEVLSVSQICT